MLDEAALDRFIDDVLAGRPASDSDDPAAETIVGLARLDTLRPPAESKAKARRMMLAHARELQKAPVASRWRQKLASVIAAATALMMLSAGTVYAASGSAPGDLLYPVKRASEGVSISFKPPGIARAQAELDLARVRLAEIKILVKRGDTKRIGTLVRELNGNLTAAGGWRSRLTPLQRQQIENGTIGLRRAIKESLPGPKTIRKNPAGGTIEPKPAPQTIQPKPAPQTIQPPEPAKPPIDPERRDPDAPTERARVGSSEPKR